mgnify:CR=1 FL=1
MSEGFKSIIVLSKKSKLERLLKEKDEKSKQRLENLGKELAELKSKNDEMTAKYEKEKSQKVP